MCIYTCIYIYVYIRIYIHVYKYTYVAGKKMSADSFAKTHAKMLATSNKTAYIHTYGS